MATLWSLRLDRCVFVNCCEVSARTAAVATMHNTPPCMQALHHQLYKLIPAPRRLRQHQGWRG